MTHLPYPTNLTNATGLLQYTNTVTSGWFGVVLCFVIGMVSYLATKNFDNKRAFLVSSWVMALSSIFMRLMGLISDFWIFIFFIAVGLSIWYMRVED